MEDSRHRQPPEFLEQEELDAILNGVTGEGTPILSDEDNPVAKWATEQGELDELRKGVTAEDPIVKWAMEDIDIPNHIRSGSFLESEIDAAIHQLGQLNCKDAAWSYMFLSDLRVRSKRVPNGAT